jgi:hypothetical protein
VSNDPGLLIHYGASKFEFSKIAPIENKAWVKPSGGLWTSPINSEWGWKEWCAAENFSDCRQENSFTVRLVRQARVFMIDSYKDLMSCPLVPSSYSSNKSLNFQSIAMDYDAIWLTEKGQNETRFSVPVNLYGWDCETVLILNGQCIVLESCEKQLR